jgi:hypothetical protein
MPSEVVQPVKNAANMTVSVAATTVLLVVAKLNCFICSMASSVRRENRVQYPHHKNRFAREPGKSSQPLLEIWLILAF